MQDSDWNFIKTNKRSAKPRKAGLTEIRGPYYSVLGKRNLEDILELMSNWIDSIKFAGGSFTLFPMNALRGFIDTAHRFDVKVSTGGFIEYVLTQGTRAVKRYINKCKAAGFDTIEISSGFITLPVDDWLQIVNWIREAGLIAKPEIGIQFGAGGATDQKTLEQAGIKDTGHAVEQAKRFIEAGVGLIMIESEGITENTNPWRTEVIAQFIDELGMEHLMFEAADPAVFEWYIQHYGPEANLFVDYSQVIQLECLRQGIWGTQKTWGKIQGLSD